MAEGNSIMHVRPVQSTPQCDPGSPAPPGEGAEEESVCSGTPGAD